MNVVMPKMGESISEGTIIKWHKKKGDSVKRDEIIFEISTDKVDTEIPSPEEGIITDILFNEGDTVEVGTTVAVIYTANGTAVESKAAAVVTQKEIVEENISTANLSKAQPVESAVKQVSGNLIEIAMPKMGESIMEGTIIKWHKKVGNPVKKDEVIFEISTDKVDTEVPSPSEGILSEILVGEQETVEVGTIVARLSAAGAVPSASQKRVEHYDAETNPNKITAAVSTPVEENHKTVPVSAEGNAKPKKSLSGFLSPLVMNIARKENVSFDELENIKGTGLEGRITKNDILNYIETRKAAEPDAVKEVSKTVTKAVHSESARADVPLFAVSQMMPVYSSDEVTKIPMDNIRQKIMQHMINSRDTSVHVSAMLEVDVSRIHNFIQKNRDEIQKKERIKLTYMPFIANACVKGLKEYPFVNAAVEGTNIIQKNYINLGIAVAIEPTGLIVPNIKAADERNIIGLAKAITDLADRARTKKLTPDDITNGTFTITNYGVFGTIFGTPIINQPEVAILGVGTVVKKPVVVEVDGMDTIAIKPTMALTLSHDHRLVDGMLGGKFLKFLKDTLENFDENSI